MAVGVNGGNNLNLLLFEVVMVRTVSEFLPPIVTTVAIHPLVVVPTTIRYSDSSRGAVQETALTVTDEIAGRTMRMVSLEGTFGGQESLGLGLYIGTGELRFKRFYHEVVRLPDAVSQDQVDDNKDLTRSPFLNLSLKPYDEENTYFAINFYDFWNDRAFAVRMMQWQDSRGAFGNAEGAVRYQMQLKEAGPLVTGGIGTAIIKGLFDLLTAWDNINELLKSYTLEAIINSLGALNTIVLGQMFETLDAVVGQIDSVKNVLSGSTGPGGGIVPVPATAAQEQDPSIDVDALQGGVSTYLDDTADLATSADEVVGIATSQRNSDDTEQGAVAWAAQTDEGGVAGLDQAQGIDDVYSIGYAARFQQAVGKLAGMSRAEYQALLESTAESNRGTSLGSSKALHRVAITDTATSIEQRYGVPWRTILDLNRLLPDEALLPGTELSIPSVRAAGLPSRIDGLPVFDSHAGQSAWGKDLSVDLRTNADGSLVIVEGEDVLSQGSQWLLKQFEGELVNRLQETPEVGREKFLRTQIASLYRSDARIAGVIEVRSSIDSSARVQLDVVARAIGGVDVTL
jgi:LysM repeat protein